MKKLQDRYFKLYVLLLFVSILFACYLVIKENQIFDLEFEEFSKRYKDNLNKKTVVYNLSKNSNKNFNEIYSFINVVKPNIDLDKFQYVSFEFYEETISFNRFILLYKNRNNNTLDGYFESEDPTLLVRFVLKCQTCEKNSENYTEPPYFIIYDKRVAPKALKPNSNGLIIKESVNGKFVIISE